MSKPPLRHYSFTWNQVLLALQRHMNDADERDGVTFIEPGSEKSKDKWFTRIRAGDNLVIDIFAEHPAPDTEPAIVLPLIRRPGPKMGKEPP
jgi:hypothetical protein